MRLFPVILAGGSGTRFWPLSRKSRPKQFLNLASNRPLIAETVARLKGLSRPKDVFVVCGPSHAASVRKYLPSIPKNNVVVEPMARNTAPAIGLAALHVLQRDKDAVVAVLPSDAYVANVPGFQRDLASAVDAAEQGYIVTVGMTPSRAETGYGYIRAGELISGSARKVAAFVEKPDGQTAEHYLASGEYLWNGGIFVFRAQVMLDALRAHAPALAPGLDAIAKDVGTRKYARTVARVFGKWPSESIDYAVAEKASNMAVVPGDFGWSDVGSFAAIPEVRAADARGNVVSGKNVVVEDCDGCVVVGHERLLSVVGMKDVVVVDSGDAVLVVPKAKSQDVRKAVDALKARRMQKYL